MMASVSRTLDNIISKDQRHNYRFTAVLGDLLHKTDVYLAFADYGPNPEQLFTNKAQAAYLREHHSDLVPPPASPDQPPSDHSLGTVFEYHYYSSLSFRLTYQTFLRHSIESLQLESFPGFLIYHDRSHITGATVSIDLTLASEDTVEEASSASFTLALESIRNVPQPTKNWTWSED